MNYTLETFPTNWDEVKLKTGRKLFTLVVETGTTENQYLETILENVFEIDLLKLPLNEISDLKRLCLNLISSDPKKELENEYLINGKRYKFITDFKTLTGAEFLDIELILSEIQNENIWSVIQNLLGVLLREVEPIKTKMFKKPDYKVKIYDADNTIKMGEFFDRVLSVQDVYNFASFFFLVGISYSQTLLYLLQNQKNN